MERHVTPLDAFADQGVQRREVLAEPQGGGDGAKGWRIRVAQKLKPHLGGGMEAGRAAYGGQRQRKVDSPVKNGAFGRPAAERTVGSRNGGKAVDSGFEGPGVVPRRQRQGPKYRS